MPSSKERMTEFGGLTRQTLPVTVLTVVIILGVVVMIVVRSSFIPGFGNSGHGDTRNGYVTGGEPHGNDAASEA